jgi:hypothetical protein
LIFTPSTPRDQPNGVVAFSNAHKAFLRAL